jgi:hypothetical protein
MIEDVFLCWKELEHRTGDLGIFCTNCTPLLADLHVSLYSYNTDFVQKLLRYNKKAVSFNHTFLIIDDVLFINNHIFHNYVHLIYPNELEIKDTTESDKSTSYLYVDIKIFYLNLTPMTDWHLHYMINVMILTLQSLTFPFCLVIYHFHLLMVWISLSWFEPALRMRTFQNEANY